MRPDALLARRMTIRLIAASSAVPRDRAGAWIVEAIGAAIGLVAVGYMLAHPKSLSLWVVEFGPAIVVPVLLVYGGYRLGVGELRPTERWRIGVWTAAGVVFGGLLALLILLHQQLVGGTIVEPGYVLLMLAATGALLGLLSSAAICVARGARPPLSEEADSIGTFDDPVARPDVSPDDELTRRWLEAIVIEDADRQRLFVLEYLHRHPNAVFTVDDLADHLLETDAGVDDSTVSRTLRRGQFHIQLRHIDLPRLADAGLISYQPPIVQYVPEDDRD
jgi:DNA-binding transcriptional ArsR family regulator